jgi:hypothetical protein
MPPAIARAFTFAPLASILRGVLGVSDYTAKNGTHSGVSIAKV